MNILNLHLHVILENDDGYTMVATNASLFHTLNEMPLVLDPARLDEGGVIEDTLKKDKAHYQQSC